MMISNRYREERLCQISEKPLEELLRKCATYQRMNEQRDQGGIICPLSRDQKRGKVLLKEHKSILLRVMI